MIDRKAKSYSVECPDCKEIRYVTYAQDWNIKAGKNSASCHRCANRKNDKAYRWEKGHIPHNKGKVGWRKGHPAYCNMPGSSNPFFGKKHTEETREKMRNAKLGKCGESTNHWLGGLVPLTYKIRHSDRYNQWRSNVFERDNWTCRNCFQKGKRIEAHHIKLFTDILKENGIKTLENALKCDELWDVDNGVTLCKSCHKLVEHRWTNEVCV